MKLCMSFQTIMMCTPSVLNWNFEKDYFDSTKYYIKY